MISIKNLSKSFNHKGTETTVLSNINLEIQSGEIFAIIGSSGAGKTTLLRSINLLETPTSGSIYVDGDNLITLSQAQLREKRKKIAMIFQHFNLINNKTVSDNIALPLKLNNGSSSKNIAKKVEQMLSLVELTDKKHHYPSQLSGGQKQRVAIARALITEPNLLLCDEATSALDPKTTKGILSLLKKINQELGITIVLISHEMDIVRQICHRFALIDAGSITEVSSITEVFEMHPLKHPLLDDLKPILPAYLQQRLCSEPKSNHYPLCQVMFYGAISQQALISELSQKYHLTMNILQANIDVIGEHTFGILVLQIKGNTEQIATAFDYFKQNQLQVETLGYVQ